MASELERLARRVAAGDLEAARRAVVLLEVAREGDQTDIVRDLVRRAEAAVRATGGDRTGAVRSALQSVVHRAEGQFGPGTWISEFGLEWQVPWQVLALVLEGVATDTSWNNDAAPSFAREFEADAPLLGRLVLWSDHPNPNRRELEVDRFVITWNDADNTFLWTVYESGETRDPQIGEPDPGEAYRAFRGAVRLIEAGREPPRVPERRREP